MPPHQCLASTFDALTAGGAGGVQPAPKQSRLFTNEVLGGGTNLGKYWAIAVRVMLGKTPDSAISREPIAREIVHFVLLDCGLELRLNLV